jgi:hypothetical protein
MAGPAARPAGLIDPRRDEPVYDPGHSFCIEARINPMPSRPIIARGLETHLPPIAKGQSPGRKHGPPRRRGRKMEREP